MLDIAIFPHLQISTKDLVTEQKRHVKAHKGVYNKVLAAYMVWDEYKCNTENVLKRIVRILKRTQKYTYSQFSMHNYSELKKYNKKELLVMLMILQKAFWVRIQHKFCQSTSQFCFLIIKLYITLQIYREYYYMN